MCSFHNLEVLVGHLDFSIVGKSSDCKYFYFTGQDTKSATFDVSGFSGKVTGDCGEYYKPMFYKNPSDKAYHLFVGDEQNAYMFRCDWRKSALGYYECIFNKTASERKLLENPLNKTDKGKVNFIGNINDPSSNLLHMIYRYGSGKYFDGVYNLFESKFVDDVSIEYEDWGEPVAYDPDMQLFFFRETGLFHAGSVTVKDGIFHYAVPSKELVDIPRVKYSGASFSNNFYIVRTKLEQKIVYNAGHINETKQYCIASSSDEGFYMELHVKGSTYVNIRDSIIPHLATTTDSSLTTSKPKSASTSVASVFLTLALLFIAAYLN